MDTYEQNVAAALQRIQDAKNGQPAIVQEALEKGVSILRHNLTDNERAQLRAAVRADVLAISVYHWWAKTFVASPKVVFGS